MEQTSRTFRLFVSSSFSDLKDERNALQRYVFPKLRELSLRHGCRFQAIDLRWGVREEAALDQQTMRICLEEINRCREVSPRLNFLVLLGDRYGWRPLPDDIPADEFARIEPCIKGTDKELLARWYKRDDNALYRRDADSRPQPVYCLQPRGVQIRDDMTEQDRRMAQKAESQTWSETERNLRRILLAAIADAGFSADQRLKYEASATEQEIEAGAIKADSSGNVFCFFRRITNLDDLIEATPLSEPARNFVDLDEGHRLDEEAHRRLNYLKERKLPPALRDAIPDYKSQWIPADGSITLKHIGELPDKLEDCLKLNQDDHAPETLCVDVWRRLSGVILGEIDRMKMIDSPAQEQAEHDAFRQDRASFFVGRGEMLRDIGEYVKGEDRRLQVISGDAGAGKSALMAQAVEQAIKDHPNAAVIARFIGVTPDSSDGRALLGDLYRQIARLYKMDDPRIPTDYRELAQEFPKWLEQASADRPLICFLDALDQLSNAEQARNLVWLPAELPEHVRLIVSSLPGECLSALKEKRPSPQFLELAPMSEEDGRKLLNDWLSDKGRTLQPNQQEAVLKRFTPHGLPLYLKLAFVEARRWRSDTLGFQLGEDIPGMVHELFQRLARSHGELLVTHGLSYLAAARNGLTEDELLDVLARDEEFFRDFKEHAYHDLPVSDPAQPQLPVAVWSRLYFDLRPYLTERRADGASLLAFYHRQLVSVIEAKEDYLHGAAGEERHRELARYFSRQPLSLAEGLQRLPNLRKLSELPYQQTCGRMPEELKDTLGNLVFLQAKVEAGRLYEAIADYELVTGRLPDTVFHEFSIAFNQEFHTFQEQSHIAAQQLYNNLFARYGDEGEVGVLLREFARRRTETYTGLWLRRLNPAPHTSTPRVLLRTLSGHRVPVMALAVSPDSAKIASGGSDGTLRVWQRQSGVTIADFRAHEGPVTALAWHPDGTSLVSAGRDQFVRVWDWQSGREIQSWRLNTGRVRAMALLGDGDQVVTGGDDRMLHNWQVTTGEELWRLRGHLDRIFCLAADPTGRALISGGEDRTLKVWDLENRRWVRTLRGHLDSVRCVAIDSKIGWAVSGGDDLTLRIWDIDRGRQLRVWKGHRQRVTSVAIRQGVGNSSRPAWIISASDDETIRLWDRDAPGAREQSVLRGHLSAINALAVDPRGEWLISGGDDATVRMWETAGDGEVNRSWSEHEGGVTCLAGDHRGELLISGSEDYTVRLWDGASGAHRLNLRGHLGPVTCLALLGGDRIVSGGGDRRLWLWDVATGKLIRKLGSPLPADDVTRLMATNDSPPPFGKPVGHRTAVTCLAPVSDNRVVSGGKDRTVRLWDVDTGEELRVFTGAKGAVESVAVSRSLGLVVAAGTGRDLVTWDLSSGEKRSSLSGHQSSITCLALARDRMLVSGGRDQQVWLWDLASADEARRLEGHQGWVNCVAVDDDARLVVSGSEDALVRVWEESSGWTLRVLSGQAAAVRVVAIDSLRRLVFSAAEDGRLVVWELDRGQVCASAHFSSPITRLILLAPDRVCVGTKRGGLALLRLEDFAPLRD